MTKIAEQVLFLTRMHQRFSTISLKPFFFALIFGISFGITFGLMDPSLALSSLGLGPDQGKCRVELATATIRADICSVPIHDSLVTLTVFREDAEPLIVSALFSDDSEIVRDNRFWHKLQVVSGVPQITSEEQLEIRSAINSPDAGDLQPNTQALTRFLADFIEPNQRIPSFDQRHFKTLNVFSPTYLNYTPICEAIGQTRTAAYTAFSSDHIADLLVGTEASNCRGRCGTGCAQVMQWRWNQYTQECLDHDACRDATKQYLGECEDEFWTAAYGYVNAPDCKTPPVPKPRVPVTPQPWPAQKPEPIAKPKEEHWPRPTPEPFSN